MEHMFHNFGFILSPHSARWRSNGIKVAKNLHTLHIQMFHGIQLLRQPPFRILLMGALLIKTAVIISIGPLKFNNCLSIRFTYSENFRWSILQHIFLPFTKPPNKLILPGRLTPPHKAMLKNVSNLLRRF